MLDPNDYESYQSLPLWKQIALSRFVRGIVKGIPHVGATLDEWLFGENAYQSSPASGKAILDFLRFLELEIDASKLEINPNSVYYDLEESLNALNLFSEKYHALTLPHDNPFVHIFSDETESELLPLFEKFIFYYQKAYKWTHYILKKNYSGKALETRITELNCLYKKQSGSHGTSLELLSCITKFQELENQSFGTIKKSIERHMKLIRGIRKPP